MAVACPPDALCASGDAQPVPHADCYWVWPGRFLAGAHPATVVPALLYAGIDSFVDLTCSDPVRAGYAAALPPHARWQGFAITDFGVPSVALMHDIVDALDAELRGGACVYLHCHAGVGRTGTALGCWLVAQGLDGREALALIARKRANLARLAVMPQSPETAAQRDFVLNWTPRTSSR
ncbi:MAG TPA: hypothetical protein VFU71_12570 [Burkholderiaceae bacterium]|nr:hypothetical protein [Burkholderiaceae bacterium]